MGRVEDEEFSLWQHDLHSGEKRERWRVARTAIRNGRRNGAMWFDIAFDAPRMVLWTVKEIYVFDFERDEAPRVVFRAPENAFPRDIGSISRDGTRIAFCMDHRVGDPADDKKLYEGLILDVASGQTQRLWLKDWNTNHVQFSPFDESWIGFAREGDTRTTPDRVWAYHATKAPEGVCLWDQVSPTGEPLFVGHECWKHGPLIELRSGVCRFKGWPQRSLRGFPRRRPARLVSQASHDWHCSVSRDGQWIITDSNDAPQTITLVNAHTGARRVIAQVDAPKRDHPFHPHPVLNSDASLAFYNNGDQGVRAVAI